MFNPATWRGIIDVQSFGSYKKESTIGWTIWIVFLFGICWVLRQVIFSDNGALPYNQWADSHASVYVDLVRWKALFPMLAASFILVFQVWANPWIQEAMWITFGFKRSSLPSKIVWFANLVFIFTLFFWIKLTISMFSGNDLPIREVVVSKSGYVYETQYRMSEYRKHCIDEETGLKVQTCGYYVYPNGWRLGSNTNYYVNREIYNISEFSR